MVNLRTEESGLHREVAIMGRSGCNMTPVLFRVVQHFQLKKLLMVAFKYVTQPKCVNKTETETNNVTTHFHNKK